MSRNSPPSAQEERYLALLERNQSRIDRLCRAYGRSAEDVDDLRSEVAFQLWRSLDSFDGRSAEDTWVYRVALNTALQGSRRFQYQDAHNQALDEPDRLASSTADSLRRLEASERLERLVSALRRLPALERAVLVLHLEELPYRRIAEITGLSVSHVGVRLHRARKRLRRWLDTETHDD